MRFLAQYFLRDVPSDTTKFSIAFDRFPTRFQNLSFESTNYQFNHVSLGCNRKNSDHFLFGLGTFFGLMVAGDQTMDVLVCVPRYRSCVHKSSQFTVFGF